MITTDRYTLVPAPPDADEWTWTRDPGTLGSHRYTEWSHGRGSTAPAISGSSWMRDVDPSSELEPESVTSCRYFQHDPYGAIAASRLPRRRDALETSLDDWGHRMPITVPPTPPRGSPGAVTGDRWDPRDAESHNYQRGDLYVSVRANGWVHMWRSGARTKIFSAAPGRPDDEVRTQIDEWTHKVEGEDRLARARADLEAAGVRWEERSVAADATREALHGAIRVAVETGMSEVEAAQVGVVARGTVRKALGKR